MFKSKISSGSFQNLATVSVHFTYILKNWTIDNWSQEPPDLDFLGGEVLFVSKVGFLPFGSAYDSINELFLCAIWPSFSENFVVDCENYSDLEPLHAPIWKVSIGAIENPSCLLSDYFIEFLTLTEDKHTIKELLGNLIGNSTQKKFSSESEISSSLSALTESKISAFSKAVIGGEKTAKKESGRYSQNSDQPISSNDLMTLLYYLFPDADQNTVRYYLISFYRKH